MKPQRTCVLLVGLLLMAAVPASARKWTSSNGKFSIEAELVDVKDGNVRLKRKDGEIKTIPVSKLSKADRDYLASLAKAKKKPVATKVSRAEAIAALKKLGGKIRVGRNKEVVEVSLLGPKVTDAALEYVKGMKSLRAMDLTKTKITDAGLEHLKGLSKLKVLVLRDTEVTDKAVNKLRRALPKCKIYTYR